MFSRRPTVLRPPSHRGGDIKCPVRRARHHRFQHHHLGPLRFRAGQGHIPNDAVSFDKIGRDISGSGNVEEISLDPTLEFTGSGSIRRAALTGRPGQGRSSRRRRGDLRQIQNVSTDRLLGRDTRPPRPLRGGLGRSLDPARPGKLQPTTNRNFLGIAMSSPPTPASAPAGYSSTTCAMAGARPPSGPTRHVRDPVSRSPRRCRGRKWRPALHPMRARWTTRSASAGGDPVQRYGRHWRWIPAAPLLI
jgi:hypothetical protein